MWIPYEFIEESPLKISPISSQENAPLVFKPEFRMHNITDVKETYRNVGLNFKVIKGMFVEGKTIPAIPDV